MVEDDDEDFGDFKFAMNSNQINARNSTTIDDDDDWGDFVDHSTPISAVSNVCNGLSVAQTSLNAMGISESSESAAFQVSSDKSPKIQWVKPQGAIPLSIFGEEEEEVVLESGVGFAENSFAEEDNGSVKKGAKSDVGVGINDMIANLYSQNQPIKVESPLNADMSFDPLNFNNSSNIISGGFNLNANNAQSYANGTEFHSNSLDFKSNGIESNGFDSGWTKGGERYEDNGDEVDDYDGWEFKAADSEIPAGDPKSEVDRKPQDFNGVAHGFEFISNGHNHGYHGDPLAQSSGALKRTNEWGFGSSFDASFVAENGFVLNSHNKDGQNDQDHGLNLSSVNHNGSADDYLWDFKDAFSETTSKHKLEESKPVVFPPNGVDAFALNGSQSFFMDDSLFASDEISHKTSEQQDFGFNVNLNSTKEDRTLFDAKQDHNFQNDGKTSNASLADGDADFNENAWEFKSALSDSGSNHKGEPEESVTGLEAAAFDLRSSQDNLETISNHQKPLPLSIFGDERLETVDDYSANQHASTYMSMMHEKHDSQIPCPKNNISINDLISSLYSQAEQKGSINFSPEVNENGISSLPRESHSNLGNDDDDDDEDSWEFKDASSNIKLPDQSHISNLGGFPKQSTKLQLDDYIGFYSKLNLALNHIIHGLLDNLEKAQNMASLSGEDAKSKAINEEIQNFSAELSQDNLLSENFSSEDLLPRNKFVDELLELLQDPIFQILDLENRLSKRLSLAANDLRSAIELLKHAVVTLKILKLVTTEEQANYVSIWYEMIFICVQELKHGALIWKESVQKNMDAHVLSEPQGRQYICALGEIYRVVEVLRASVKLYKPWILLGYADPTGLLSLLNECSDIWSSSGLNHVVSKIDDPIDCTVLLDSINFVQNLDESNLQKHVLSGQQSTCCLSLLSAESIPGLELVVWNGKNYFLRLANLWANLVSRDPPSTHPALT